MAHVLPNPVPSRLIRVGRCVALGAVVAATLGARAAHAIEPFTDGSDALTNSALTSGVALGVADLNGDGLDDIVRLHNTALLEIEYQQADGSFERYEHGEVGGSSWALALGDINNDGLTDIFTGGAYNGLKILTAEADGGGYTQTTIGNGPPAFVQCTNFADIDNDGNLDLFVCHDDGLSPPFRGDGRGGFSFAPELIAAVSTVPSDNSGNYGSIWIDYDNDGDTDLYLAKCRLTQPAMVDDPANPGGPQIPNGQRTNLLFRNDGDGNWTELAEPAGLRPLGQSWTMDFADIDNDGDLDGFLINHDILSALYRNEGPKNLGTFTDITAEAGIASSLGQMGNGIQNMFRDFDNDGFVDLLVTGNGGQHRLFMNGGDGTFAAAEDPFPTPIGIHSAVVGDLNNDGQLDVLAAFATIYNSPSGNPDRLFLNAGSDNNWIAFRLQGVQSNRSAVGARVTLTGAWGTQIREVRGGEGYGISNTLTQHFGLGTADVIDTVTITWPSGQVDSFDYAEINMVHPVMEGCTTEYFADVDGDGFGDPATAVAGCVPPRGFVEDGTDCAPEDPDAFPGNAEVCDGADNDCDGTADNGIECAAGSSGGADGASSSGAGEGPGADGGATATATATATGTSGDTAGGADGGEDGGCSCRTDRAPRAAWLMFLLLPLAARRRRVGARH